MGGVPECDERHKEMWNPLNISFKDRQTNKKIQKILNFPITEAGAFFSPDVNISHR